MASTRRRVAISGVVGAVGLLWVLPFVWTEHRFPLASLDAELAAATCLAFALACCGLVARADAQFGWRLPALLALLITIGYLQLGLGQLTYPLQAHRLALFAAASLLGYMLGRQLVALDLVANAVDVLAVAAIAGGTYSALIQWLQLFDLEWLPHGMALILNDPMVRDRPFANLAQANHLATYLGFAALSALYCQSRTPRTLVALGLVGALLVLASGLAITGSRMGTLYALLLLAALVAPTGLRPPAKWARALDALALVTGYLVGVVAQRSMVVEVDALARFGQDTLPIRIELWRQALQISLQHPLLGIGVGQFPAAQLWVAHQTPYTVPGNNAHNLLLQLAAEFGWPAAIAVVALALWWCLGHLRSRLAGPQTALALGMMMLIGIHSMLEFPLWHLYFAVPAALLFAIAEPQGSLATRVDARRVLAASGLAVLGVVLSLRVEYDAIVTAAEPIWLDARHMRAKTAEDSVGILLVADSRLFRPEAERLLLELKHPQDEKTAEPLLRSERVLHMLAGPEVISQRILQLTRAGRIDEAIRYARRLPVFAGPNLSEYRDWILDQTRDLGPQTAPLRHVLREAH